MKIIIDQIDLLHEILSTIDGIKVNHKAIWKPEDMPGQIYSSKYVLIRIYFFATPEALDKVVEAASSSNCQIMMEFTKDLWKEIQNSGEKYCYSILMTQDNIVDFAYFIGAIDSNKSHATKATV